MSAKGENGHNGQGGYERTRAFRRFALEVAVTIVVPGSSDRHAGHLAFDTRDLSAGGAFLSSGLLLEVGESATLELELPEARRIEVGCRVVRVERGAESGMGVLFTRLADADRVTLLDYLGARVA